MNNEAQTLTNLMRAAKTLPELVKYKRQLRVLQQSCLHKNQHEKLIHDGCLPEGKRLRMFTYCRECKAFLGGCAFH